MNNGKRRILLVDDEPSIIKVVGKRLELAGFEVVVAVDGQEALAKARLSHPDAIILDLMLPKLSGLEVCAALKEDQRYCRIPVIIFTGKGQEIDETLCRECRADAYINKSRRASELIEQLEALLGRTLQSPPEDAGGSSSDAGVGS